MFQETKGVKKHSVLRSKVLLRAKCSKEVRVLVAKGVKEQGVLRSNL